MAMSDELVAVGSQSHVSLVDPRCQAPVQDVPSLDMDHGEGPCPHPWASYTSLPACRSLPPSMPSPSPCLHVVPCVASKMVSCFFFVAAYVTLWMTLFCLNPVFMTLGYRASA